MVIIKNEKIDYLRYGNLYVELGGFSIIPVNAREKKGSFLKSWKKYQKKLPNEQELKEWTQRFPDGDLAVVTGKISNLIVLDIDPRHGGDQTIKDKKTPETVTVETGGGGLHYYYTYPEIEGIEKIQNFTGKSVDLPGLDLRADGGMVYAPPSLHQSGKKYQFKDGHGISHKLADPPDWLIEVIKNNQKSKVKSREKRWHKTDKGRRNDTYTSYSGKLLQTGVPLEVAVNTLLKWNEENPTPLPKEEVIKIVEGIYSRYENNETNKFLPTEIAKILKRYLKIEKKEYWVHIPEIEQDYCYPINEGYFYKQTSEFLKKSIRDVLISINPEWESNSKINEVYSAFCHLVQRKFFAEKLFSAPSNKNLINVKNGMLDWKSGELKDHSPKYFSLYQLPVEYDPNVKCILWKKTLAEWIPDPDTREFLQQFIGYSLIPDTSQHKSLILLGQGANGKTTFLEVIRELFGDENMSSIPLHRLGDRFEVSKLQHSLVNVCDDIDPVYMKKTGTIKTIISGGKLRAEEKYKPSYEFRPVTRLIFAANEIPKVKDKSDGWYRRFEIIKFEQTFKAGSKKWDPKLKEKLIKELPGILNWALNGLKSLEQQGAFKKSEKVAQANSEYREINDSVEAFVGDKLRKRKDVPKFVYPKKVVYEKYKDYCKSNNLKAVSRKKMSARLAGAQMEFKTAKRRSHRYNLNNEKTNEIFSDFEPSLDKLICQNESYKKKKSVRCFVGIEILEEY